MSQYFVNAADGAHHEIFPGVHIHTHCGTQMMLSLVEMAPHARVEPHDHPHEQVGILLVGELTFTIGEDTRVVLPGEMWRIPGGVTHHALAGAEGARALDVFTPIRDDYR